MSDCDMSIHHNPDAKAWSQFFCKTVAEQGLTIADLDEGVMISWFANAMMAMHDHLKSSSMRPAEPCSHCGGCGSAPSYNEERDSHACFRCGGTGKEPARPVGPCPKCSGIQPGGVDRAFCFCSKPTRPVEPTCIACSECGLMVKRDSNSGRLGRCGGCRSARPVDSCPQCGRGICVGCGITDQPMRPAEPAQSKCDGYCGSSPGAGCEAADARYADGSARPPDRCKRCGDTPAYPGAEYCGAACSEMRHKPVMVTGLKDGDG